MTARPTLPLLAVTVLATLAGACSEEGLPAEDAAAITALFKGGLSDADPFVRAETLRSVGVSRSLELYPLLVEAQLDKDPMVRSIALVEAARVAPDKARPDLVARLRAAKPKEQRFLVRHLLAVLEHGDVEDAVIKVALRSEDEVAARYGFLYGVQPRLRDSVMGKREQLGQVSRLVDGDNDELAGRAMRLLAENGQSGRAEAELRTLTKAKSEAKKLKSLRRLSFAGVKETEDALRIIAKESGGRVRAEASLALVSTGDSEAVSNLREVIGTGSVEEKTRILEILPRARGAQSLDLMRPYRGDARELVEAAAQQAMAEHPMTTLADLRRGLYDTEVVVAEAALLSIHMTHPDKVPDEFRKALKRKRAQPPVLAQALGSARYELWLRGDGASLATLDTSIGALRPELLAIAKGDHVEGGVAAAELVFLAGDPAEIVKEIDALDNRLRYAYVRALAESVDDTNPEAHRATFVEERGAFLFATRAMASAGLWRGYVLAAGPQTESTEP